MHLTGLYTSNERQFRSATSLVTFTDVERWKNAAHERYPSFDLVVKFRHLIETEIFFQARQKWPSGLEKKDHYP